MSFLSPVDWLVIFGYLLGIVLLGAWCGKDQHTTRDFFLGNKSIPWWGIGVSIVAAETSALTVIGVPGIAYGGNMALLQMIIGYVLARIILAVVMTPHYLRGEIYSPYQLLSNKFGPAARKMAGGFFLFSETLAAGVRVYVVCILIRLMLGLEVLPAIVLFVVLSLIYSYIGGVKAVIWTDAAQFGLFLAGGLFTLGYIANGFPGGTSALWQEMLAGGKLHWLNPHFGIGAPINLWMGVIGGTFMVMSSHGAEQLIVQRVLACRTVLDGRKALILSAALIFPLFVIFLFVGAMLWVFYQHHAFGLIIPHTRGLTPNDSIYPIFMLTEVPHALRGFLIVAILAAGMSSVSSALTSLASVSTMDFFQPLFPGRSEKFFLRFSKWSMAGWSLALVAVAFVTRQVEFVYDAAFALRGLTSGALLGGVALAVFAAPGRARPIVAGMSAALGFMVLIHLLPRLSVTQDAWKRWIGPEIFWPWYTLIGFLVMMATTWLVARIWPDPRATSPSPA